MRGLAIVILSTLTACGPGSYGDFRSQLQSAACNWAVRCGVAGRGEPASCGMDDVLALMHDSTADRAAPDAIDIRGDVSAGRLHYSSYNAQDCIDAVSGSECDPTLAYSKRYLPCSTVVSPNVENGNPCWADMECVGGLCVHDPGCSGECTPYASFGEACVDDTSVPPGQQCDPTVAWCDGSSLTCQRKKESGVKCELDVECAIGYLCQANKCGNIQFLKNGAACGGEISCANGLYCDPTTLVCTPQSKQNAPCDSTLACSDGLACIGLVPVTSQDGMPVQVTTPGLCGEWLIIGAACTQSTAAITGCPASETCNGSCTAPPQESVAGQSCESMTCAAGLGCNGLGNCDYLRPIFGDCSGDSSMLCEPGLQCSQYGQDLGVSEGRCVPQNEPACFLPREIEDGGDGLD